MTQSTEQIYDEQISPLILQIIAICNAAGIKMLSSFALVDVDGEKLHCTTALLENTSSDDPLRVALRAIRQPAHIAAFTVSIAERPA